MQQSKEWTTRRRRSVRSGMEPITSDRTYTALLKDRKIRITGRDLATFRRMYVGDTDLARRMSELLWFDIFVLDVAFGVGPHEVLASIRKVEEGDAVTIGVKPVTQFKNLPLKG